MGVPQILASAGPLTGVPGLKNNTTVRGWGGNPLFENMGREKAKMVKKSAKKSVLAKTNFIHFTKVVVTFAH